MSLQRRAGVGQRAGGAFGVQLRHGLSGALARGVLVGSPRCRRRRGVCSRGLPCGTVGAVRAAASVTGRGRATFANAKAGLSPRSHRGPGIARVTAPAPPAGDTCGLAPPGTRPCPTPARRHPCRRHARAHPIAPAGVSFAELPARAQRLLVAAGGLDPMPLPYALNHINLYTLDDGDRGFRHRRHRHA